MARIAIASSGKDLESPVDPRFGRCPYFVILEEEGDGFEVMENTAGQAFQGAGISAAQMIAEKGVTAVIAGNFGPKALWVLGQAGVKLYGFSGGAVEEAREAYRKGELTEYSAEVSPRGSN